jgi:hypothetical protein
MFKNNKNDNDKNGKDKDKQLILDVERIAIEGVIGIFMATTSVLKDKKL